MASSISTLSYLDPSAYESLAPQPAPNSATGSAAASDAGQAGNGGLVQLQAIQQQGDLQAFLSNSAAAALLQPSAAATGDVDSTTLINNMLQQVLGAYNAQSGSA